MPVTHSACEIIAQVNLFMGVALLSIVYAVAQGGWLSFVPLLAAGMVMCLSGGRPSPAIN